MIIGVAGKIQVGKDTVGKIIQYLAFINEDEHNSNYYPLNVFMHNLLHRPDIAIKEGLEGQWVIKKYADKLKDIVCLLIGCTREQLEDQEFKNTPLGEEWNVDCLMNNDKLITRNYQLPSAAGLSASAHIVSMPTTPRLLMQLVGTECGRNILHPNTWVNATMADYHCDRSVQCYNRIATIQDSCRECPLKQDWIITDVRFPNEVKAIEDRGGFVIRVERLNSTSQDGHTYVNKQSRTHPSETALDNHDFEEVITNNGTIGELIVKVKEILIRREVL